MTQSDTGNDDPLNESTAHLLHKVGQFATEVFAEEVGGGGLTARQFAVLSMVERHLDLSQTDLVELTGIDRSTLADIVRRMLKKELLVRRRTEEDQRAYAIRLSDHGRSVLENHKPNAARADNRILAAIPIELREAFTHALKAIASSGDDGNDGKKSSGTNSGDNGTATEILPRSNNPEPDLNTFSHQQYAPIRA